MDGGGGGIFGRFSSQKVLNGCNFGDALEFKPARRKMRKMAKEDIYWQNCQSYGVNLSLEACHLVDKESLANNCGGDDDEHSDDDHEDDEVYLHQVPLCVL